MTFYHRNGTSQRKKIHGGKIKIEKLERGQNSRKLKQQLKSIFISFGDGNCGLNK